LDLEPEGVACLEVVGSHVRRVPLPAAPPPPVADDVAVKLRGGWTLTIPGTAPVDVDPGRGWEQQGFETFAGTGTYRCGFEIPPGAGGDRWTLTLPVVECAAHAELNGTSLGGRGWPPYRFEIPAGVLREGENDLALHVANAAANRYYAGTRFQQGLQPSGLGGTPVLSRFSPRAGDDRDTAETEATRR
ncbi:MAG TPA: hypothetical protein VMF07_15075, partial [Solirubrobacteraceae bacterium]|nr:hypothetical protein [Solirubrobacteraceae bacterium]